MNSFTKVPFPTGKRGPKPRFVLEPHTYPTGSTVWQVRGRSPDGKRIREFFRDKAKASVRRNELENEWHFRGEPVESLRPTVLSTLHLGVAEDAFRRLTDPHELKAAVDLYLRSKAPISGPREIPDLDGAWEQFQAWLDDPATDEYLRPKTKSGLRNSVGIFVATLGNRPLAQVTPELVKATIEKRWTDPTSRDDVRRTVSRFFSFCIELPRLWLPSNPAWGKVLKFRKPRRGVPEIFTLAECARLLVAARDFKGGKFLRYVVLGLFCGLRPGEIRRAQSINLDDGEIHLDSDETKTNNPRTVSLDPVAVAWLKALPSHSVDPLGSRLDWDKLRKKAKLTRWPNDVLRHTAISHFFRRGGSYGLTAEWAGNSEGIIKKHYQGRVSSAEAAKFWSWHPDRKARRALRDKSKVVPFPSPESAAGSEEKLEALRAVDL